MKDFVYVFKDEIRFDLITLKNRLDDILKINDKSGFKYPEESFSIFPALFRLYAHLWLKDKFCLFKKKYINYEGGKKIDC